MFSFPPSLSPCLSPSISPFLLSLSPSASEKQMPWYRNRIIGSHYVAPLFKNHLTLTSFFVLSSSPANRRRMLSLPSLSPRFPWSSPPFTHPSSITTSTLLLLLLVLLLTQGMLVLLLLLVRASPNSLLKALMMVYCNCLLSILSIHRPLQLAKTSLASRSTLAP